MYYSLKGKYSACLFYIFLILFHFSIEKIESLIQNDFCAIKDEIMEG